MRGKGELLHLVFRNPLANFIVFVDKTSLDLQARGVGGGTDIVDDGFIAVERSARPVHTDMGKELMFDRIPLGGAWRIVADGNGQLIGIAELMLQMIFPGPCTSAVGAAAIGEDEQLIGS